jgi:hypothetical protein
MKTFAPSRKMKHWSFKLGFWSMVLSIASIVFAFYELDVVVHSTSVDPTGMWIAFGLTMLLGLVGAVSLLMPVRINDSST